MAKKLDRAFLYSDYLTLVQESLAIFADIPGKFRFGLESVFQNAAVKAFENLKDVKCSVGKSVADDVKSRVYDSVIELQLVFETALKLKGVANGRMGHFIETTEKLLKRMR